MRNSLARIRRVLADVGTLYLLPGGVALLPWPVGFALLRRIARSESLYRLAVEPAWDAARRHFPDMDERDFKFRFRLLRLVDHADVYLTLLRGRRWRRRYIDITGNWPDTQPGLLLTYHWGTGNWIWPMLRERGVHAHFLARRASGRALGLTKISHAFGHFRAWALRRIGSAGALFTGGSAGEVAQALRDGRSIVGMLDLAAQPEQGAIDIQLLDRAARFPQGLLAVANQAQVSVALFSFGLDLATGRRQLRLECLADRVSPAETMSRYAAHLDARLREQPAAWQIWREAPAIFAAEKDAAGPAQGLE